MCYSNLYVGLVRLLAIMLFLQQEMKTFIFYSLMYNRYYHCDWDGATTTIVTSINGKA